MTFEARVAALAGFGFTPRQAGFLVTVMLHAGVCLDRQYCAFAHIAHGQKTTDFFERLTARRYATAYRVAQNRARIFHVQHRALYAAIGEPDNRHRKPTPIPRAVERLMVLDDVLAQPEVAWLATETEKVNHFTMTLGTRVPRTDLPHLVFGDDAAQTVRYFPDKLPIGLHPDGRRTVFCYLVTHASPVDFRTFLHRHVALLQVLPAWTLRILVPTHLVDASKRYSAVAHQELASPLRLSTLDELQWYFETCRRLGTDTALARDPRFRRAHEAFAAPRFRALYRTWRIRGDAALSVSRSSLLADALIEGRGRVECHVLARRYLHLSSLVGTA